MPGNHGRAASSCCTFIHVGCQASVSGQVASYGKTVGVVAIMGILRT
jgi:hypothetical protein